MLGRYRVLDLTDDGAMICGQILADLGADVLLVEPPGGAALRTMPPFVDGEPHPDRSLAFWAVNRNKRGIALDLESEGGRSTLRGLAARADFLIESKAPGYLAARGLAHTDLAATNPGLITVSISPFGQEGPKATWAATDLIVSAASGVLAITGDDDRAPLQVSVPQAHLNAGAEAAVGALIALQGRHRTGRGQHVDVSGQTAMMAATQSFVLCHGWNDKELKRVGGGLRMGDIRLRFVYPCKDGFVNVTFLFGAAIGPATGRLFQWMWEEGFVDEATRDKDWLRYGGLLITGAEPLSELARCIEAIERFTLSHTKAELFEGAFARNIYIVPLSDMSDVAHSTQLAAREFWRPLEHPEMGRAVTYPGPFARFSSQAIEYRRRPPLPGEHGGEVESLLREPPRPAAAKPSTSASGLPLEGVKVLDFTWVYAGPAATRYLADYGATVVRIESTTRIDALRASQPFKDGRFGAERSGNYSNVNVGKLGLSLNMKAPEAREVAMRLARWADVVVENFSPRAMAGWGMDYASLRAQNPAVIMVSTCLNGQTGPEAHLAGYGTMGAALAGFGFLTGWPDRPPASPFLAYTDYTSPRFIAAALMAAIEHRNQTGEGQHIDCSQAEASTHFLGSALLDYLVNGNVQKAAGNAHPAYAPSGVYPCEGEDRWLALAAPNQETWARLCGLAGGGWETDPRFTDSAARLVHREELDEAIAAWTRGWPVEDLEQRCQDAGIPAHRASTSADLAADPQLEARGHFVTLEHPVMGPVPLESSRLRCSEAPALAAWPGPMYGEHNDQVLREILGMGDEEIVELVASGALE